MPGSYRGLTLLLDKSKKQNVKAPEDNISELVELEMAEGEEGVDGKWDL